MANRGAGAAPDDRFRVAGCSFGMDFACDEAGQRPLRVLRWATLASRAASWKSVGVTAAITGGCSRWT
jgi:hypothetical protein